MAKSFVEDIDKGYQAFKKEIERAKNTYVKVGVMEAAGDYDAISVAEVAAINEYGTENNPERPFMRNAYQRNFDKLRFMVDKKYDDFLMARVSLFDALTAVGMFLQGEIQREIVNLKRPPNSPRTIELKGSSNPLIDSGQLRQSITYEIEEMR